MLRERSFNDFALGDQVITRARTITEADVVSFAGLSWDFYPLHTDEEYCKTTRFGTRIAHGPLVYTFAVGIMPIEYFGDGIVAFLGLAELRHLAPVFIGDTIHVVADVTDTKPSSKASGGTVTMRYSVRNQTGHEVMTADMRFLMRGEKVAGS